MSEELRNPGRTGDGGGFRGMVNGRNLASLAGGLVLAALIYVLVFMPTPYVVYLPGAADPTHGLVHVKQGYPQEQGALMLTYVNSSYPNWLTYARARLDPDAEIMKKSNLLQQGQTEQSYYVEQQYMMRNSQSNAIQVVYNKLKIPYKIVSDGVMIVATENTPAGATLSPGDEILAVDGKKVNKREDVLNELAGKQVGDRVKVQYKHGSKTLTANLPLVDLNRLTKAGSTHYAPSGKSKRGASGSGQAPGGQAGTGQTAAATPPKPGLGVMLVTLQDIKTDDPSKQVTVDVGNIIGPSAGTMIALEIYNQLTPTDLTKGYRIAGTGEIDAKGDVIVIGGIQQKVVAANNAHADIFFAPKDLVFPNNAHPAIRNYSDALAKAKQIHTKMKIVPIGSFDDALKYLQGLPPKPGTAAAGG